MGPLAEFRGVARRLEPRGEAGGVTLLDDYAHNPPKVSAALGAVRERYPDARVLVLFQPHLYSRTRHLAHELGASLATADVVAVTDVYPAREEPLAGVTGKLVVDALSETPPGDAARMDADRGGRGRVPGEARAPRRRDPHRGSRRRRRRDPTTPGGARREARGACRRSRA